jgi:rhodanese-related sulfurtransferase
LDIRKRHEQLERHIPNSIRLPLGDFLDDEEGLRRVLESTNRGAVIVVIASGDDVSGDAVKRIREWGYRAYAIEGGFNAL